MRHSPPNSGDVATCSGSRKSDGDGGAVVVVGMKMDKRSRELLTWALVNVVQTGDRVIAIHVVDPNADKSTLLDLMQSFSSVLDAYGGFCNLKQVDLKFKIRKGSPARKILVEEAKLCGTLVLIIGASAVNHRIRSRIKVAEYCAKSLSKNISILCVDNGKILFHRSMDASNANITGQRICVSLPKSSISHVNRRLLRSSSESENVNKAIVPFKKQKVLHSKPRWGLLQSLFLCAQRALGISSAKKALMARFVARLPHASVIYPIQKQITEVCTLDYGLCYLNPEVNDNTPCSDLINSSLFSCKNLLEELNDIRRKFSTICRLFTYQELLLATNNFSQDNLIGKGGSCLVYKGFEQGGKALAVKILKPSKDILEQFVSEVEILTSMHHKNIIHLVGLCFEEEKLLLVYNLSSRGSMEENLHSNEKDTSFFGWEERYKVAIGVAKALDYLHNNAEPIIHRDVKSSNILLLDNFEAQLSDFGLATRVSCNSHRSDVMEVSGTFGYLAPEYFFHGKVSEKIDVYAFGVVLLELLSGRKPVDYELPKGQESLVIWAKGILHEGKISELQDPKLVSCCNFDEFEIMASAAALCIRSSPQTRPGINTVLKLLECEPDVIGWAKKERRETCDNIDDDIFDHQSSVDIQSFLDLALLNLEEEDSGSSCSTEQNISVENYLKGRQSCSSIYTTI